MLFCGLQADRPVVAWTNSEESLVAVVKSGPQGPGLEQLYIWWRHLVELALLIEPMCSRRNAVAHRNRGAPAPASVELVPAPSVAAGGVDSAAGGADEVALPDGDELDRGVDDGVLDGAGCTHSERSRPPSL